MKTIQEAAEEYAGFNKIGIVKDRIKAFKAGAKFVIRWISVDELPEIKEESYQILVKTKPTASGKVLYRAIAVFSFDTQEVLEARMKKYQHWRMIEIL